MRTRRLVVCGWLTGLMLVVALTGCGESDPFLAIESQRAGYTAQVQGSFYIDERVIESDPVLDAEGNPVDLEPTVEKDVLLDILVKNGSLEPLPGITVDFEHVDSAGNIKSEKKMFINTSKIGRGNVAQFSQTLVDVDYVEGDAFAVSVRTPIPESERSEYREFDGAGGQ